MTPPIDPPRHYVEKLLEIFGDMRAIIKKNVVLTFLFRWLYSWHGLHAEIKYMNNENNFIPPDFFDKKVEQTRQELYLYIEEPSDIEADIVPVKEEKYSVVIDLFGDENE